MSALAVRTGALNLGQGFPDVDGPPSVIEKAVEALRGGRNQYAPGPGVPELRAAVAAHQARHYGLELDPQSQVLVTAGATEAIAAAILALVDPGDEVVVLEPFYDSYVACIEMAGGVRRPVTLRAPDFRLDVDALRAAASDRATVLLLNSPHNPTGTVLTREELEAVAEVAVEHDLVVVTDEVYEHLVYDDREHVPLCTLPGMWDRTVSISSAGKTFSFTGWKVGWVTGPAELVDAVMSAKQWLTFTNAAPLQPAIAYALDHEPGFYAALAARAPGQARPALRGPLRARPRRAAAGGDVLRHHRRAALRLRGRPGVLPRASRAGRRGGDPDAGVLRRPGRGPAPGAVGVLQGDVGHRGGPAAAAGRRPARLTRGVTRRGACPAREAAGAAAAAAAGAGEGSAAADPGRAGTRRKDRREAGRSCAGGGRTTRWRRR